ncbi:MOSC domain protein [Pelotomaculum schinkii]|uniref:MOSC domain protein n=1 Tax=Pelotomaculum schinkii TaxID=78350 RepID=A0A4Y7R7Z3_9FIRM|nr:MOSC domain protein [Pelotomaculum schinkii]
MGKILSINISAERGIEKTSVSKVQVLEGWGLEGDAHGGEWDRQVSLLPVEALEKVPAYKKEEVQHGGYTENFTITGIPLEELSAGKVLRLGDAEVIILCIGKEEYKEHGRPYIVSREGRFGRVVKGGKVKVGDNVTII